jgi:hypothetical protein
MKTQQIGQEQGQEQKQELIAEEPYRVSLKAERVQEPAFSGGGAVPLSSGFELTMNQVQPLTIDLLGIQVVITLHGTNAGQAG